MMTKAELQGLLKDAHYQCSIAKSNARTWEDSLNQERKQHELTKAKLQQTEKILYETLLMFQRNARYGQ